MKKIIEIVIASLMFANIGYAEIKGIEHTAFSDYWLSTICVDGYKYVVASSNAGSVSVVQSIRNVGLDRRYILPEEC